MRRNDREITDRKIIEEILTQSDICRIAMFDQEFPYIVPFNFGYRDNVLYFHSASSGKKINLLQQNNKVCFEIEQSHEIIKQDLACKWSAKYRSVIGFGSIEIITDTEEKKKGLDIIMSHYGRAEGNIYNEQSVNNIVILKLSILEMSGKQSG